MFGLLVKVVGRSAVDPGLIPGTSQFRQISFVWQEIANSAIFKFLFLKKIKFLNQVLIKPTLLLVFVVLAYWQKPCNGVHCFTQSFDNSFVSKLKKAQEQICMFQRDTCAKQQI